MAQMLSALGTALLMTIIAIGMAVQHNHDVNHADTEARQQLLDVGRGLAIADFKTRLEAAVRATNSISNPPATITSSLSPCTTDTTNRYCSATISYTATLASNDIAGTQQAAVLSPSVRGNLNDNRGTDPAGKPVYNATTYRMHTGLVQNGKELSSSNNDLQASLLDSYPISVIISTVRPDAVALTASSVGYADTQCGNTSLGCATLTTGADTTVPNAKTDCFDRNANTDPTLGDACSPVGLPTSTPHPHNNIIQHAQADGTNASQRPAP